MAIGLNSDFPPMLSHIEIRQPEPMQAPGVPGQGQPPQQAQPAQRMQATAMAGGDASSSGGNPESWKNVSRNAACPCGSGKKYKHCHGKLG